MKRILISICLSLVLVGYAEAKSCVTKKVAIAINNPADYYNMIFVAGGGEQDTQEYARELIKRGNATILPKGEEVNVVNEYQGASFINIKGSVWILPSVTLQCR